MWFCLWGGECEHAWDIGTEWMELGFGYETGAGVRVEHRSEGSSILGRYASNVGGKMLIGNHF